jgi:hypothetical protein
MIGILGISLPIILFTWSLALTGSHFLLDSISSYYHTNLRDALVGILCAVSVFLLSYHGYDLRDFITFKIAGISALGVAFFPAFIKSAINPYIHIAPNVSASTNAVHFVSAALFFLALAYVSLVLFTRTHPNIGKADRTRQKIKRNRIYRGCGITILACLVLLLLVNSLPAGSGVLKLAPVFWIETIALFAFGASWLVKGEVILREKAKSAGGVSK